MLTKKRGFQIEKFKKEWHHSLTSKFVIHFPKRFKNPFFISYFIITYEYKKQSMLKKNLIYHNVSIYFSDISWCIDIFLLYIMMYRYTTPIYHDISIYFSDISWYIDIFLWIIATYHDTFTPSRYTSNLKWPGECWFKVTILHTM